MGVMQFTFNLERRDGLRVCVNIFVNQNGCLTQPSNEYMLRTMLDNGSKWLEE